MTLFELFTTATFMNLISYLLALEAMKEFCYRFLIVFLSFVLLLVTNF